MGQKKSPASAFALTGHKITALASNHQKSPEFAFFLQIIYSLTRVNSTIKAARNGAKSADICIFLAFYLVEPNIFITFAAENQQSTREEWKKETKIR